MIYLQFSGSEELNTRKQCAINLHKCSRNRSDLTGRVSSLDFTFKWTFTLYLITGPYMSFMKAVELGNYILSLVERLSSLILPDAWSLQ